MNEVYTVWGSEDQGFRFPVGTSAFAKYDDAMKAAIKHGGTEVTIPKGQIKHLSNPLTHGKVVKVLSYDNNTFEEALESVSGDVDSLDAVDWVFIVKTVVK